jgi:YD repeat-containing protein
MKSSSNEAKAKAKAKTVAKHAALSKTYNARRQRTATILATIYILASQTPLMIGLAAPQVYFRPAAGVSRLPLQVAAFDAPGFGEVEDAINLATGNVYVAMDGVSRNNLLQTDPTKNGTDTKDETATSMPGNWSLNARLRLEGFNKTGWLTSTSIPAMFIGTGDGAGTSFQQVTMDAPAWTNAPSWIKRYQTMSAADLNITRFYALNKKPGEQYSSEWIVLRTRPVSGATGGAIAHYYTHNGSRNTFYNDGEYVDYTQSLPEQYRGARYNLDPEGEKTICAADAGTAAGLTTACTPKTQFTYDVATGTTTGRITKVKDAWGRVTTYDWNATDGTLTNINYLVQNEAPTAPVTAADTAVRRATFQYSSATAGCDPVVLGARVVCSVTYFARSGKNDGSDAKGAWISRQFNFKYAKLTNPATIVLTQIQRPGQGPSTGFIDTNYTYYVGAAGDVKNGKLQKVTQTGMADITYSYTPGVSNGFGGQTYTINQGDLTTGKQIKYLFDKVGQMVQKEERDYNPTGNDWQGGNKTRTLTTKYAYYAIDKALQSIAFDSADNMTTWPIKANVTFNGSVTDLTNTDSNGLLDGINSATGSDRMKTTISLPAGMSLSPSMVLATDAANGANIKLGLEDAAGVKLIPDTLCTLTTTPNKCLPTGVYKNTTASAQIVYVVLSEFWTSVRTFAGGTRANAFTTTSSTAAFGEQPYGSTKSVTDPAGKTTAYTYDDKGNVGSIKIFEANKTTPEREQTFTYNTDNDLTASVLKGTGGNLTRNGLTYSYQDLRKVWVPTYYDASSVSASIGGQTFRTLKDEDNQVFIGVDSQRESRKNLFDERGRMTSTARWNGVYTLQTTSMAYWTGSSYGGYLYNTDNLGNTSGGNATPSKQYGDWVQTYTYSNGGNSKTVYYNGLGQPVTKIWSNAIQTTDIDSGIFSLTRNCRITHALDPITTDQSPTRRTSNPRL